jgi:protein-S-isoprenylcysteine O-methyltransferase Ste14
MAPSVPSRCSAAGSKDMPTLRRDKPPLVISAPLLALFAIACGWVLDHVWWFGVLAAIPRIVRAPVGLLFTLLGFWLMWHGGRSLKRSGTNYEPWKPSLALAEGGIYSRTRNPMYQGLLVFLFGVAFLLRSDWMIILLMAAALVIHYGLVLREEAYLQEKFGADYQAYLARAPRYGWRWRKSGP